MNRRLRIGLGCVVGALTACAAQAATYTMNFPIGAGGATGFITTDGTIGVLSEGNITAWNLLLNDGSATFRLNSSNNLLRMVGIGDFPDAFSATAGGLFFDFESNSGIGTILTFEKDFATSPSVYFCGNTRACTDDGNANAIIFSDAGRTAQTYTGVQQLGTISGAVPEPASWAMLIAGFGLVGAAARRRRMAVNG